MIRVPVSNISRRRTAVSTVRGVSTRKYEGDSSAYSGEDYVVRGGLPYIFTPMVFNTFELDEMHRDHQGHIES